MTARALRVGVVLNGNLVEERMFSDASPITVGQSLRCRLSVPAEGVPHEHVLFVRDQGRVLLRVTAAMTGRLATGSAIRSELREGPPMDGVWSIPIERGTRGKLQIGDATILFQEVAAPTPAPRPQLPAGVRGTFADRVDRRLAAIVGASLALHAAIGVWAWMTDVEETSLLSREPVAQYRHATITLADEIAIGEPTPEPGAATPATPIQTPAPIVKTPARITSRPAPAPRLPTTDDAARFAQMLTGNDEGPGGRTEIGKRLPGSKLEDEIRDIRDNNRTIGNEDGGFRRGPRDGISDDDHELEKDAPTQLEQQAHRPERTPPGGRIDLRPVPPPPGDMPVPALIIAKIRNEYMRGLMRCYKQGLVGDHELSGKVKVSFTVSETGRTTDAEARGLTSEVDACIQRQMTTWRFPISKDKDGDAVELDVALTLALVPST